MDSAGGPERGTVFVSGDGRTVSDAVGGPAHGADAIDGESGPAIAGCAWRSVEFGIAETADWIGRAGDSRRGGANEAVSRDCTVVAGTAGGSRGFRNGRGTSAAEHCAGRICGRSRRRTRCVQAVVFVGCGASCEDRSARGLCECSRARANARTISAQAAARSDAGRSICRRASHRAATIGQVKPLQHSENSRCLSSTDAIMRIRLTAKLSNARAKANLAMNLTTKCSGLVLMTDRNSPIQSLHTGQTAKPTSLSFSWTAFKVTRGQGSIPRVKRRTPRRLILLSKTATASITKHPAFAPQPSTALEAHRTCTAHVYTRPTCWAIAKQQGRLVSSRPKHCDQERRTRSTRTVLQWRRIVIP